MSDVTKWVTDGWNVGRVVNIDGKEYVEVVEYNHPVSDWRPATEADFVEHGGGQIPPTEQAWKTRAEAAEARVAELDDALKRVSTLASTHSTRAAKLKARVAELEAEVRALTPPDGHVAVMLQRECIVDWLEREVGPDIFHKACRKALEADDE